LAEENPNKTESKMMILLSDRFIGIILPDQ